MKKVFAYIFMLLFMFSYSVEKKEENIVRDRYGKKYILYTDRTWRQLEVDPLLEELEEKIEIKILHLSGKRGRATIFKAVKNKLKIENLRAFPEHKPGGDEKSNYKDYDDKESLYNDNQGEKPRFKDSETNYKDDDGEKSNYKDYDDRESLYNGNDDEKIRKIRISEKKDRRTFKGTITNNYTKDIKLLSYAIKFKHFDEYVIVDTFNVRNLKKEETREFKETVNVGGIDGRDYIIELIKYEIED